MLKIPYSSIIQKKALQLHQSKTNPSFYISIEKYKYDSIEKAIFYEIEIGFQHDDTINVTYISKRYSELFEFEKQIKHLMKNLYYQPNFPPKRFFKNFEKTFLDERNEALQNYLSYLCKIPNIFEFDPFFEFFNINKTLINC